MFDFTPEGDRIAWLVLVVYGCTMWLDALAGILISGVLRCGGDTRFAMLAEVSTVWLIGVPIAFITSLKLCWPLYLAVLAVRSELVVKNSILLVRYKSKKWLKNVIKGL